MRGVNDSGNDLAAAAVGMAVALELFIVAVLGSLFIFVVLEARPLTQRMNEWLLRVSGILKRMQRPPDHREFGPMMRRQSR